MMTTTITQTDGTTLTFRHRAGVNVALRDGVAWATCSLCCRAAVATQFNGNTHAKRCDMRGIAGIETL